ncbi:MAG: protoporphyrinogen oxidase [Planctomycetota bacterium]|nr:protoporphyrinogen oxidase [Planctomycetota bacterium]
MKEELHFDAFMMPMSENTLSTLDCAIIGGGISGLTALYAVHQKCPAWRIRLFETQDRLGGILETRNENGFLIETSADSFITDPSAALKLCEDLGLGKELISTRATGRRAEVLYRGRLTAIPDGFQIMGTRKLLPLLTSPILSWRGKLRACCEPLIKAHTGVDDESLAAFAKRRMGREAFDRLIAPLVGGIYTADPEKLSMAAALPRFREMERTHGSIYRGLKAEAKQSLKSAPGSGARYSLFATPRGGLGQLLEKLAMQVPSDAVRKGAEINYLERQADGLWRLELNGSERFAARKLIIAIPAFRAAQLLQNVDVKLAESLQEIPYASCAVVCLAYDKTQFRRLPESFGFIVPACEQRPILAASFTSNKFSNRAPDDQWLVRVFLGGACQEAILEQSDTQLAEIANREMQQILGVRGAPCLKMVVRWPRSMPQYHVGHTRRIEQIENRVSQLQNVALIGNAYHGVGIPQCIDGAIRAAELLVERP